MAGQQEEEVLGKAYDSRLMRRLLTYLRPYKWHVVVALVSIVLKSIADVLGPFVTKVAVDKYLTKSGIVHSWLGDRLSSAPLVGIAGANELAQSFDPGSVGRLPVALKAAAFKNQGASLTFWLYLCCGHVHLC